MGPLNSPQSGLRANGGGGARTQGAEQGHSSVWARAICARAAVPPDLPPLSTSLDGARLPPLFTAQGVCKLHHMLWSCPTRGERERWGKSHSASSSP